MKHTRLPPAPEKAIALSHRLWDGRHCAQGREHVAPDPETNMNRPKDRLRVTSEFEHDEDMNKRADD